MQIISIISLGLSRLLFGQLGPSHHAESNLRHDQDVATVVHVRVHLVEVAEVQQEKGDREIAAGEIVKHGAANIFDCLRQPREQRARDWHSDFLVQIHKKSAEKKEHEAGVEAVPDGRDHKGNQRRDTHAAFLFVVQHSHKHVVFQPVVHRDVPRSQKDLYLRGIHKPLQPHVGNPVKLRFSTFVVAIEGNSGRQRTAVHQTESDNVGRQP